MWGAYFCMGTYKHDVAVVMKMGAYIHRVFLFYGCLSQFYSMALSVVHINLTYWIEDQCVTTVSV